MEPVLVMTEELVCFVGDVLMAHYSSVCVLPVFLFVGRFLAVDAGS
jgi:hypothetical protein